MSFSVVVSGATGYAGGEVLRLLATHPEVEVKTVAAHSSAGQRLGDLAPHLRKYANLTVQDTTVENLAGHDVVFLALPHGASAEVAAQLPEGTLVIDAGADHRLESASAWEKFYQSEHAGFWPYGLPELLTSEGKQREALRGASRIAVPGCYPTASILALNPGFAAGLLQPRDVVIIAASGTSGAGKSLKPHLLGSEIMGGMLPYGVGGGHRHTPEIEEKLSATAGEPVQISFTPTLAPMPRGILATATAKVKDGVGEADLRAAWESAYTDEPFVHLLPEGQWPHTKSVQGSNHAVMQLAFDEHAGRVIVTSAIDNLAKGTAGGAIQSMNIALGLEENLGLAQEGLVP
ncbi:N-acetyl-gamma-glutamyl-phosphate reductase [Rothia aerolata]|uniref:N-acetyl-gamma-glutamyl-phosphate reductase n=1 Tax=Rothia aerolata TaxID=1812262 RepID=A0A917IVI1_9MICC|nr:N-acetyl-gamma-glutamyl-phosphate reductase [Rothia aerolata]GGH63849.1 N-acetyl-gamma-glutamyl-phosphate reductase [Rothia aerolata]